MPNSSATLSQRRFCWLMILASVLILFLGETLSRWLGLYGSVVLVWVVCGVILWPLRVSGSRFDIANVLSLFVAYYFLSFGMYGFMNAFGLSHFLGVSYVPGSDSSVNLSSLASVYSTALLLAIYAGYSWSPRVSLSEEKKSLPLRAASSVDLRMLLNLQVSALLALGLSYTGFALMVFFLGGISVIGRDPTYVATGGTHGLYWAVALISTNHWAFVVNFFSFLALKKIKYLFLAAASVPLLLLEFLLSGSKGALLFPLVGLLIVRHYCYRRINWRTVAALGAVVLVVFAAGYVYRSVGAQRADFGEGMTSYYQDPSALFETFVGRFYGTDSFAIVLDSVHNGQPLLMGRSFADLLTWYIPRWLWPGKPVSFAITFGQEFMSGATGAGDTYFSPSLPGELYLDFGRFGLLLGGIAVGFFLHYLYRKLIHQEHRKIESIVLYAMIAPLAAQLSEAPVSTDIEFILTRVILYAFLLWLARIVVTPLAKRCPA
jgi:oligosaccharide repeat unit polymerase